MESPASLDHISNALAPPLLRHQQRHHLIQALVRAHFLPLHVLPPSLLIFLLLPAVVSFS
jgi:hypothetical protein